MMSVPYVAFAAQYEAHRDEILDAIDRALKRGDHILGSEVEAFEESLARLCETRFALGVGNGTDALMLVMKALGIGPGDEVITAPNSFLASASAIALVGARPVFADVGEDYNLDPMQVEKAITPGTRAVIPVHLTGRPAHMDELLAVTQRHGLHLIEDAAQAIGARYKDRPVGSFGVAGCFSMHPLKNLNASGDAGAIVTGDETLMQRLRLWRNHGLRNRDECLHWGHNSRMDNVQAAVLNVRLRYLDQVISARRRNARRYYESLGPTIEVPCDAPHEFAVYHTLVVQVNHRDRVQEALSARGVETKVHYPSPLHLQPAASYLGYRTGDFPIAERQAHRVLSLPVHQHLSEKQLDTVARELNDAAGGPDN